MDNIIYTKLFRTLCTVLYFVVMFGSSVILLVQALNGGIINNGLNSLVILGTGYSIAVLSSYHGMVRQRHYSNVTNTSQSDVHNEVA